MSNQTSGAPLPDNKSLSQHQMQQTNISSTSQSQAIPTPASPNHPLRDLVDGPREKYIKIGVPVYEASIRCDWKAAKPFFENHKEMGLVSCAITENLETALHVAASAKNPKHVQEFVKNLVDLMDNKDLALQNKNHNTASI